MEFKDENKTFEGPINSFNQEMTYVHFKKVEDDFLIKQFDRLNDLDFLKALSIKMPELATDYIHLFVQESFDEN